MKVSKVSIVVKSVVKSVLFLCLASFAFGCDEESGGGSGGESSVYAECIVNDERQQEVSLNVGAENFAQISTITVMVDAPTERFTDPRSGDGGNSWFEQYQMRGLPGHRITVDFTVTDSNGTFKDRDITTCK
jgi:hypothetical protein